MVSETMNWMNEENRIAITDDYMFGYVMRQPGVCTSVIKCLLPGVPVAEVKFADEPEQTADTQKTIQGNLGTHSVSLMWRCRPAIRPTCPNGCDIMAEGWTATNWKNPRITTSSGQPM